MENDLSSGTCIVAWLQEPKKFFYYELTVKAYKNTSKRVEGTFYFETTRLIYIQYRKLWIVE